MFQIASTDYWGFGRCFSILKELQKAAHVIVLQCNMILAQDLYYFAKTTRIHIKQKYHCLFCCLYAPLLLLFICYCLDDSVYMHDRYILNYYVPCEFGTNFDFCCCHGNLPFTSVWESNYFRHPEDSNAEQKDVQSRKFTHLELVFNCT